MGRPPKPSGLRMLEGNPGKRPIPAEIASTLDRTPTPPEFLDELACTEWRRVAGMLVPARALAPSDLGLLEAYCCAYSRWRRAEAAAARLGDGSYVDSRGTPRVHPLVHHAARCLMILQRVAVEFGLTPSSRSRIRPIGDSGRDPVEDALDGPDDLAADR